MIDFRITTFLTLCETMNYRITAEKLNMTQPAVTQHIQYLEKYYGCKLFLYNGKTLSKTKEASILEHYSYANSYNEHELVASLSKPSICHLKIGATKTIGEFVIAKNVTNFLKDNNNNLSLIVDNTMNLLHFLDSGNIDFAVIEGFFDKKIYDYELFRYESFVGICSPSHHFAGKEVDFDDLLLESLILRELGSGTRDVFEQILYENNFSIDSFRKVICINNFSLILNLVSNNIGISFVYETIAKNTKNISMFTLKNKSIVREFNYIYLKNTSAKDKLQKFLGL